jgi:hypothetical protein
MEVCGFIADPVGFLAAVYGMSTFYKLSCDQWRKKHGREMCFSFLGIVCYLSLYPLIDLRVVKLVARLPATTNQTSLKKKNKIG